MAVNRVYSITGLPFHFQVAWMLFDKSAILTVQSHVITRNPRISVTHDKHRTWFLHIKDVREDDKGKYMCQINTATAKTQYGYLHVVGESLSNIIILLVKSFIVENLQMKKQYLGTFLFTYTTK